MNVNKLLHRMLFLFRRRRLDRELDEEMRFHLEMNARAHREAGLSPEEAAHAARREFGNPTLLKEVSREMWGWASLERLAQDLRYALRMLRKNPGFTTVAVLTLALGIGANTAIFSVTYALLLRMLPVADPEQLKLIVQRTGGGSEIYSYSYPAYKLLREQSRSLAAIAAASGSGPAVISSAGDAVERVWRQHVSGDFFSTLGLRPFAGRFFTPEEDRAPGANPVAVISFAYWERKFSRSPAAVGAGLIVDETPFTIIGVAPPRFSGVVPGHPTDLWIPAMMMGGGTGICVTNPGCQTFRLLARVKPGIPDEQAAAELDVAFRQHLLERARAIANDYDRRRFLDRHVFLASGGAGDSYLGRQYQKPLAVLMVLVGLVLVLACANVTNMLLARASARVREIAIRFAIGGGRRRIVRQLLTESIVLALIGGAVSLLFAAWGARALVSLFPEDDGIAIDVTPDLRILAFTAAISLCSGLLFGLAPALRAARGNVAPALKAGGPNGRTRRWAVGRLLVVAQVALSVLLLVGAGLFVRTLENLQSLDPGFTREDVLTFSVATPRAWKPEKAAEARQRLLTEIRLLPGVVAAGAAGPGPLTTNTWFDRIAVEGYPARPDEDMTVNLMRVSPGFFETVRTPLKLGRLIGPEDRSGATRVAVVNETFARYFFAGANPLGRHVDVPGVGRVEIVGVAGDARYVSLREKPPRMLFVSAAQTVPVISDVFLARSASDPRALALAVRQVARQIDPALRTDETRTMTEQVDDFLARERMLAKLSGFFGLLATIIASLGLYSVISYAVSRRTNEIGIRMALGAQPTAVLRMVLGETLMLVATGLAVGIPAVLACGRFVASMLFGLKPADPRTIASAALLLSAMALLACCLPARRAAGVDPVEALRHE